MAATWAVIADDVVTLLEPSFAAANGSIERAYVPENKLEDLAAEDGPTGHVIGKSDDQQPGRKIWERTVEITITVQKRVADKAEADTWAEFVEDLAGVLKAAKIVATGSATLVAVKVAPTYAPGLLREKSVFFSILTATYKLGAQ